MRLLPSGAQGPQPNRGSASQAHPLRGYGPPGPARAGQRIMTERTDHQVLVSIAQLLEELLTELRHIRAQLREEP